MIRPGYNALLFAEGSTAQLLSAEWLSKSLCLIPVCGSSLRSQFHVFFFARAKCGSGQGLNSAEFFNFFFFDNQRTEKKKALCFGPLNLFPSILSR